MSKFYAVKKGRNTGIFTSWDGCKEQVDGFKGAEYKSFGSEDAARVFLGLAPKESSASLKLVNKSVRENSTASGVYTNKYNLGDNDCIAYVDGSWSSSKGYYSYGAVLFTSTEEIKLCGCDNAPYLQGMHNVTGELLGAMVAVLKAEKLGKTSIFIVHDYEGTGKWADTVSPWRTNKQGTFEYSEFICNHRAKTGIFFKWVKGHSGVEHNEDADKLAKMAIDKMLKCDSASVFKDLVSQ